MNIRLTPTEIAVRLGETGLCVCPDFFTSAEVQQTRADLHDVRSRGDFARAGVGHPSLNEVRTLVRNDETHWLDRERSNTAQDLLWNHVDALKTAFNRTLYLGLTGFEGHYASYAQGGFYRRHLDSFAGHELAGDPSRIVSIVLYLNESWQASDGGELRVYSENSKIDIEPLAGTLVCFMSREFEHEVLMSYAPRISVSGWFTRLY